MRCSKQSQNKDPIRGLTQRRGVVKVHDKIDYALSHLSIYVQAEQCV